jgi:hypothetical protein
VFIVRDSKTRREKIIPFFMAVFFKIRITGYLLTDKINYSPKLEFDLTFIYENSSAIIISNISSKSKKINCQL